MKLFFLFLMFFSFPVYATEQPAPIQIPVPDLSSLKHTKSGRVDKVIDGLTILLKDKTIVRLASLDIPDFHIWRDAPHSDKALKLLEDTLPTGTEIMLYQTVKAKKGRLNRMNHALAHIVTKSTKETESVWINGALLAHGIARVMMAPTAPEMANQMLKAETAARQEKRGIWADDSEYRIQSHETAEKYIGQFAIIEGRVEKAASVRNNVYLNFGKDWKTDFTIMINPTLRKKLAHGGIHPLSLGGETVQIRGWLREYNGPLIELDIPEHLQLIQNETE
jgi:endonuclease YncB( thermonuclease family)